MSVTVKCDATLGSHQFDVFVSQPQAPGSFGFFVATCTGSTEKYLAHVQSNFGTLPGLKESSQHRVIGERTVASEGTP